LESGDALALLLALSEDVNRFADKITEIFGDLMAQLKPSSRLQNLELQI